MSRKHEYLEVVPSNEIRFDCEYHTCALDAKQAAALRRSFAECQDVVCAVARQLKLSDF